MNKYKMNQFDVDFHIHSKYSGGTSIAMEIPLIAKQAELKGLNLVGTGDALHPGWLSHIRQNVSGENDGVYTVKNSKTKFLITAEIEDANRVHHLILFPSISSAESLFEKFKKYSTDIGKDGRPHLRLNAEEILDYTNELEMLVGPAHAFTPWTAAYKEYNSISECYGKNTKDVKFLELGLSADTDMADRIEELQEITFMSNSDTHSPWPHRLGREFNRILVDELSFNEIRDAIGRKKGRKFVLNAGLNPMEGKYHLSACSRCYLRFKFKDAKNMNWRCPECKGSIKKGVFDRVNELAVWEKPRHPEHRPGYMHIIPLAEIISLATGISAVTSKRIKERWDELVHKFGTEINILIDSDIDKIKNADMAIGQLIEKFRSNKIRYVAGGGGQYGRPALNDEKEKFWDTGQKSLWDF